MKPFRFLVFFLVVLLLCSLFACKTSKISSLVTTETKTETYDSAWSTVNITVPPKKVELNAESLFSPSTIFLQGRDLRTNTPVDEYRHYNSDSTLYLSAQVDSLGNIVLACNTVSQTLQDSILTLNKTIEHIKESNKTEITVKKKGYAAWMILGFALLLIVILFIIKIL